MCVYAWVGVGVGVRAAGRLVGRLVGRWPLMLLCNRPSQGISAARVCALEGAATTRCVPVAAHQPVCMLTTGLCMDKMAAQRGLRLDKIRCYAIHLPLLTGASVCLRCAWITTAASRSAHD